MPDRATPPAPAEPGTRSAGFLLAYALANAGGAIGYLPLLTLLLPARIEAVAGPARIELLTLTAVAGAVAASGANIAFGWLSDRSLAAGRGRRRWMAGGLAALALAYGLLVLVASPAGIVLAVLVFQVAVNALLAPLAAIMADEVPDGQKGVAGGLLALAAPAAFVLSTLLVAAVPGEAARLAIVPVAAALLAVPLLLAPARPVPVVPSPAGRTGPPGRDLAVAWGARLMVQVSGVVLSLYLLYFVESVSPGLPRGVLAARAGALLAAASAAALPAAALLGRASDRAGRRKPFLFGAAAVAAAGLAGMAAATDWRVAAAGYAVYATGAAVFLALHAGFAMQLLPDPRHRGRDLGLLNLTNTLPSILGPPLAWWLATPRDFSALLLVLAALTLAGGTAMLAVRGRR